ncbi:MAG: hypothetical protein ACRC33_27445, partial [Gemmataceae bacterium]
MAAVLLIMLAGPPTPDGRTPAEVARDLAARFQQGLMSLEKDPTRAVAAFDALLDDPGFRKLGPGQPATFLSTEQIVCWRAQARLRLGEARAVADEMTDLLDRKRAVLAGRVAALVASFDPVHAALAVPPARPLTRTDWLQPLGLRMLAWQSLGEEERARADLLTTQQLVREMTYGTPQPSPQPLRRYVPYAWLRALPWLLAPAVVLVMTAAFYVGGMRQRRDAGGTRLRLFLVALALAAAQAAPVLMAVVAGHWWPDALRTFSFVAVPAFVFLGNAITYWSFVTALTWESSRDAPPLLTDPAVLERVRELAGRLGVPVPVTRLVRSASSQLMNQGLVAGLAAPTMVLFDGILYRMS